MNSELDAIKARLDALEAIVARMEARDKAMEETVKPAAVVRYFHEAETIWRVDESGAITCKNGSMAYWLPAASTLQVLTESNIPEITADQAEAILKGAKP
jgi:hypothetical protein